MILYLGDFDRAGVDAMQSLHSKLRAFADESGADMHFIELGVTPEQNEDWNLPTREPKRQSAADKKWPHSFACELDAIPPNYLRGLVQEAISYFMPTEELAQLKKIEEREKQQFREMFFFD